MLCILAFAAAVTCLPAQSASSQYVVEVPGFTAYVEPAPEAMEVSESVGISNWKDKSQRVVWYGYISGSGSLTPSVRINLPPGESAAYRFTAAGHSGAASVLADSSGEVTATFPNIAISKPGYFSFRLEALRKSGPTFGTVKSLELSGPAAGGARFNLKERRNAASVHLMYSTPKDAQIEWFYNEVTVKTDPIWSYYMACGFHRGYFGIQINSPTERRIIFSVWDSGSEGVDRSKVGADDRVQLLAKGEGVYAGGFGNEGTGGHSHMVYPWKTGETYRFLVAAEPDGTHTIYSGYFYFPEKRKWGLIASFRAPKDGGRLRGLYSFNEDFGGPNGQLRRLAQFGNQWIKLADGTWQELTQAKFSHDGTGKQDRLDYEGGVENGRFFLSNGGFVSNGVKYGDVLNRTASGKPPADITLPARQTATQE